MFVWDRDIRDIRDICYMCGDSRGSRGLCLYGCLGVVALGNPSKHCGCFGLVVALAFALRSCYVSLISLFVQESKAPLTSDHTRVSGSSVRNL